MRPPSPISIGLLGLGTVGSEVYRLLADQESISARAGMPLAVTRVAVAGTAKLRSVDVPPALLTADAGAVVESRDVDIVVELIGGLEPARGLILRAMHRGKSVVTANKQVMAAHGTELLASAQAARVDLCFEGSVGGGIPLIKPIRESLAAGRISRLIGILNGTTNYILTRMTRDGSTMEEALADARQRGFAEADPTEDLDGHDAAAKLAILASVAFHTGVSGRDIFREGIRRVTRKEIGYAAELGFAVKLLAIARRRNGEIEARVHPALLPQQHPLAVVPEEFNAVLVEGEGMGPVVFSGRGAGGAPTAVAVVGDVIDAARNLSVDAAGRSTPLLTQAARMRPMEDVALPYYLSFQLTDRPGVFARVATVFGEEHVSIASIVQKSRGEVADAILVTHETPERSVRRVLARLEGMDVVKTVNNVMRVEAT
ncbi:MAG: homoserine dehydrogenase [bacterium]